MATQLGELQVESIDGVTVRFWYRSLYESNVYEPTAWFARSFVEEWCEQVEPPPAMQALMAGGREALDAAIVKVAFDTPGKASTFGTLTFKDASVLEGMAEVCWDSYLIG